MMAQLIWCTLCLFAADTANDPLPEKDPYTFLEKCLERYDKSGIKGYTAIMHKQERIGGTL